jgi:hypothetical protein
MLKSGYALYEPDTNRLRVIRPGENCIRYINCMNLNPRQEKVFGVQIDGDEIWILVGPQQNQRPNRKIGYRFSSLNGGYGRLL